MTASAIKVEHINPFIHAAVETFKLMAELEITPAKPTLKKVSVYKYDISGIIGLSGEAVGSIALCFNKSEALSLIGKFIDAELTELNQEAADAAGELANIVAGYAKQGLKDLRIEISLPSVIMGSDHKVYEPRDALSFIIPFSSDIGGFDMDVTLKKA